jgi:hypothetical protein
MTRRPPPAIVLMFALGMAACNGPSSMLSAPTPLPATPLPTAPQPRAVPSVPQEVWNLTATFRSFTGPDACLSDAARLNIGQPESWVIAIERSGESIHLSVSDADDPSDRLGEYDGTVVDGVLTAAIPSTTGRTSCGGGLAEGHLSGRFSGNGGALTAEDVRSIQISPEETIYAHYDWSAARQ